jgi:RNA polymerase sigma factor (TIGR02999 family)
MDDVEQLIEQFESGDQQAIDELLPIVYKDLRRLASRLLASEAPGHSLQTTDLAHDAYLRLAGSNQDWHGLNYFLAAAAEAMRRILVERARNRRLIKRGGRFTRVALSDLTVSPEPTPDEVIMISDLLDALGRTHALEAQIVKLHYFAGLSISEAGSALGLSSSTAHRYWSFARAWLHESIHGEESVSCSALTCVGENLR